ncbi:conserved exported hypothetical protein [Syntrophobacter sp. SbD1]|nr:conserved exported hypothetical protein [Syntrophobacter sp. SbD1]
MKTNKWALCLGVITLFAGLCAPTANADLYFETESISTNVPNRPNNATTLKSYFTSDASRWELGDGKVIILDYNAMKLFMLDPKAKTYRELNLGERPGLPDTAGGKPKMMEEPSAAASAIRVTPTDETKTIAGYKCSKYNVKLAMSDGEYWVSKDVKGYQELKTLGAKMASIMDRNPMLKQFNIGGMSEKIDGFPVYTVSHVMGGTIERTLKNIEQKPLDSALFKIPSDYALAQKAHQ